MYATSIDGRRLGYEVYGVWRKNMLMRDRETGSMWQHATGEAIDGPLKGRRLEVLAGWETTWGELRAAHPEASYIQPPARFTGVMPKPVLLHALHVTQAASLDGLLPLDQRLEAHAMVIGVVVNGASKAYPLDSLRSQEIITDEVGGETLRL